MEWGEIGCNGNGGVGVGLVGVGMVGMGAVDGVGLVG